MNLKQFKPRELVLAGVCTLITIIAVCLYLMVSRVLGWFTLGSMFILLGFYFWPFGESVEEEQTAEFTYQDFSIYPGYITVQKRVYFPGDVRYQILDTPNSDVTIFLPNGLYVLREVPDLKKLAFKNKMKNLGCMQTA